MNIELQMLILWIDDGLEFTAKPRLNDGLRKSSSMEFIQQLEDDGETPGKTG